MPVVTLFSSPNGLPIATTTSPDRDLRGVGQLERMQRRRGRLDLQHGEVGRGIDADDGRVVRLAVREANLRRLGAVDDVGVRDHVAARVVDEAGALRLRRARAHRAVGGRLRRDGDLDHGRVRPVVDLADRQRAVLDGLRGAGARGRCDCGRAAVVEGGVGRGACAGRDDEGGGAGGDLGDGALHVCPFAGVSLSMTPPGHRQPL